MAVPEGYETRQEYDDVVRDKEVLVASMFTVLDQYKNLLSVVEDWVRDVKDGQAAQLRVNSSFGDMDDIKNIVDDVNNVTPLSEYRTIKHKELEKLKTDRMQRIQELFADSNIENPFTSGRTLSKIEVFVLSELEIDIGMMNANRARLDRLFAVYGGNKRPPV